MPQLKYKVMHFKEIEISPTYFRDDQFYEQLAAHIAVNTTSNDSIARIKSLYLSKYKIQIVIDDIDESDNFIISEETVVPILHKMVSTLELCNNLGIQKEIHDKRMDLIDNSRIILNIVNYNSYDSEYDKKCYNAIDIRSHNYPFYAPGEINTSVQSDVWRLGVVIFLLLTNKYPFGQVTRNVNLAMVLRNIVALNYDKSLLAGFSAECQDFFALVFKPENERITLAQVKTHPWYLKIVPQEHVTQIDRYIIDSIKSSLMRISDNCIDVNALLPAPKPKYAIVKRSLEDVPWKALRR